MPDPEPKKVEIETKPKIEIKTINAVENALQEKAPKEERKSLLIKERAREMIAFILVFGFLSLLLSSFLFSGTVDEAIKLIQTISASLSGLIGAVLGYYFGRTGLERSTTTTAGTT